MSKVLLLISAVLNIIVGIWGFTLKPEEAVSFMAIFFGISIMINAILILVLAFKGTKDGEVSKNFKRALLFRGILSFIIAIFLLVYPTLSIRIIIVTLSIFTIIDALTHLIAPNDKFEMISSIFAILFSLFLIISATFTILTVSVVFYILMAVLTINGIRLAFLVLSGRTNIIE